MAMVDVIIPLYNKQATIERTIRSVQSQTFKDWRLIVVDDGSTDRGPQIVDQMRRQDLRIELIGQSNAGPGAARNAGIYDATAPYLAFLDADDQWYSWHLENAMTALQTNPVAIAGAMYYEWPERIDMTSYWARLGVVPGIYQFGSGDSSEKIERFLSFFTMVTTFMQTEIARKYGGFYESQCRYGEDTILITRIVLNESFMVLGGKPSARYNRQHSKLTKVSNTPLNPMLLDSQIILKFCPAEKHALAAEVVARKAMHVAFLKARNGYKAEAIKLASLNPQMKTFGWAWRRCQFAILFSRILPYWVQFKCLVGPPVRRSLRQLAYKVKLLEPPPSIPTEDKI